MGIEKAKPGNRMSDVDKAARDYIEKMGYGKYFTHRTGHSIGMETHEAGDVSKNNDDIIREGQVFSVEPGIYLPEEDFGVSIEHLLPIIVDGLLRKNKVDLTAIETEDKWIGITYKEDADLARAEFKKMLEAGKYPKKLWD